MTRIVAGRAGGRLLTVPPRGTRPTSDRVREALFSRLEHLDAIEDGVVLDLYAGSGALGLEAASRGARSVTLVDASARAAEVCRRNVRAVGLPGVVVVAEKARTYLDRRAPDPVHLALVDPPYDVTEPDLAHVLAALVPHLHEAAVVVVERSSRSPEPTWPPGLAPTDRRRYGETVLWFAEPPDASPSA